MNGDMTIYNNLGTYIDEGNVVTFQIGTGSGMVTGIDMDSDMDKNGMPLAQHGLNSINRWIHVDDYNVCARGRDNRKCERIEQDIKNNRLLPRLIGKQVNMLYGKGPRVYRDKIEGNKVIREWSGIPAIEDWLKGWLENGMEMSYTDFAMAIIKRYYFFRDYFVKWRMSQGKLIGRLPVAGMELVDNRYCRLGTLKTDVTGDVVLYNDFRYVLFGNWNYGAAKFKVYPLFRLNETDNIRYAAISHHRETSVGSYYGENETHEGVKTHLKTSNELPEFIDSFLNNLSST
jgi:hypothetical protein